MIEEVTCPFKDHSKLFYTIFSWKGQILQKTGVLAKEFGVKKKTNIVFRIILNQLIQWGSGLAQQKERFIVYNVKKMCGGGGPKLI